MRILFTLKQPLLPFIEEDINMLSSFGVVKVLKMPIIKKVVHFLAFLPQLWHVITRRYDLYYCFFNDYHAVLPVVFAKLYGKKSIVVVAGFDAVGVKNEYFNYGIFNSVWRTWCARVVYKRATHIISVSRGSLETLREFVTVDGRYSVIPFGWDIRENIGRKENHVLMVGIARDRTGYIRKGYDRMRNLALKMPEVKFICAGLTYDSHDMPSNVEILGFADHKEVLRLMSSAKVFLQPSRIEGMPNTLAEAMASGCHVAAAGVFGIPELCERHIFPEETWDNDLDAVVQKIHELLNADGPSYENSERIAGQFSLALRKDRIKQLL